MKQANPLYKVLAFCAIFTCFTNTNTYSQAALRADGAARIVCTGSPFIILNNVGYINNASSNLFTAANSNVNFTGATTVVVSSTGPFNTTFYNNTINKTGGSEIDVTSNGMTITTSNTLTMTSGNVDMNNNLTSTWELGTSTANLGTLARTSGHFYRGYFRRWFSTATPGADVAQWDIPVGMSATSYNYARVYYPSATSGGSLRTRFVPTPTFYNGLPLTDNTNTAACGAPVTINNYANEGYWEMTPAGGLDAASNYTVKLCYANFATATAELCLRIIKSENSTSWMQEGTHGLVDAVNDFVTRDAQTGWPGAATTFFTVAGDLTVNPLPVELTSFTGHCGSSNNTLQWTTASENNNAYFVLERSANMLQWEIAAMIPSQNSNSNVPLNYSFDDHGFNGTMYYRLSQVDNNGTAKTYDPIALTCTGGNTDPVIVNAYNYDQQVTMVLFAPTGSDYVLGLYDLQGKKLSTQNGMLTMGNNTITLDASALRDAYYVVHIQIGDKNLSRKIFVK